MRFLPGFLKPRRQYSPSSCPPARSIATVQTIDILYVTPGSYHEVQRYGKVTLDSGCKLNLISKEHAQRLGWQGSSVNKQRRIGTGFGGGKVVSLDRIEARWYISSSNNPRYETSIFHVVDEKAIDVVMGSETIAEHGVFDPDSVLFGSLTTYIPPTNVAVLTQETAKAKNERALAQQQQKLDEERKKREKAAQRS
ncbi:hypothetical protein C7974DRAFT_377310 [Boeremia exigua]|uniref:uncharacterized protein n=1 Tax=Boeremia exigua TaxID=749465 RepID=UPI001E8CC0D7|nr:uncharacterized protein C7974DRAFT_377310 [Boeremia exigua]KAH6625856.1 hypothetical protein C7974DRAFT_377310 [Boeremia exigua]